MPAQAGKEYPDAQHAVEYLADYEKRYGLPVERPVRVLRVHRDDPSLRVETGSGTWPVRAVISATGTWWRPFLPAVPGRGDFGGRQLHTVAYGSPQEPQPPSRGGEDERYSRRPESAPGPRERNVSQQRPALPAPLGPVLP